MGWVGDGGRFAECEIAGDGERDREIERESRYALGWWAGSLHGDLGMVRGKKGKETARPPLSRPGSRLVEGGRCAAASSYLTPPLYITSS